MCCFDDAIKPSKKIIETAYQIDQDLKSVKISSGNLTIVYVKDNQALIVKTHKNIMPLIKPTITKGCLSLNIMEDTTIKGDLKLEYILKVKTPPKVQIAGKGNVSVRPGFGTFPEVTRIEEEK